MLRVRAQEISRWRVGLRQGVVVALILTVFSCPMFAAGKRLGQQQANPTVSSAAAKSTAVPLEPGKTLDKTLTGGETHTYEIQVQKGQFLHAIVEHSKMPKAEALRQAQVALLRGKFGGQKLSASRGVKPQGGEGKPRSDGAGKNARQGNYMHPYYWAPFILIGNWR